MQVRKLAYLAVVERAALALAGGGLTVAPHVEIGDELLPALENLQQRHRPVGPDQRNSGIHLDHRQPPPRRRDRVTLVGMRLLPYQ
jgi:hypothetical protein